MIGTVRGTISENFLWCYDLWRNSVVGTSLSINQKPLQPQSYWTFILIALIVFWSLDFLFFSSLLRTETGSTNEGGRRLNGNGYGEETKVQWQRIMLSIQKYLFNTYYASFSSGMQLQYEGNYVLELIKLKLWWVSILYSVFIWYTYEQINWFQILIRVLKKKNKTMLEEWVGASASAMIVRAGHCMALWFELRSEW